MDYQTSAVCTPELRRLSTFQSTPSGIYKSLSNSPLKFVEAGFERGATDDEVVCRDCGGRYRNWEGESPMGVHRVISPNCPFVSPSSLALEDAGSVSVLSPVVSPGSLEELAAWGVRRRLFPSSPLTRTATDVRNTIKHPVKPARGGYELHLASLRLQTYPGGNLNSKNEEWAENGFVYVPETGNVQCIYCGVELMLNEHYPKAIHKRSSPLCPLVLLYDIGNVSRKEEQKIRLKHFRQQSESLSFPQNFAIMFPHYEGNISRCETYKNWPNLVADKFPPQLMADAGFYYTGFLDKVTCYACGVSFHDWVSNADVWRHHAKASPRCYHIVQNKSVDYIQDAVESEIIVKLIRPDVKDGQVTASSGLTSDVPGSCTLDAEALKAAFAPRYPDKTILLGVLSAADENNEARRKLRQDLHFQQAAVQEKDQALQAKDQALQRKDQVIQAVIVEKDRAMQEKDRAMQEKDRAMQEKDRAMQEKDRAMQEKDRAMQEKDRAVQVIQEKDRAMQEKDRAVQEVIQECDQKMAELDLKNQEIKLLKQQLQSLRAHMNTTPQQPEVAEDQQEITHNHREREIPSNIRCKVCLSAESSAIFMPCSHISTCIECASTLHSRGQPCPVCRSHIENTLPAFIS